MKHRKDLFSPVWKYVKSCRNQEWLFQVFFFFFFCKVERMILERVALSPQSTVYKSFFELLCHIFSFPWTFTWWERIPQEFGRNITLPNIHLWIPIMHRKWGEFNKIVTTRPWQLLTSGNRSFWKSEHWLGYLEFSSTHWPPPPPHQEETA